MVAELMVEVLTHKDDTKKKAEVCEQVRSLAKAHPIPETFVYEKGV
jgi:glycine/serine hydroxymethyltransferase